MYAIKDIKKGDEITYDCSLNAIDQIKVEWTRSDVCYWNMECHCGSKNCRKVITGDFFELPKNIQLQKLPYLPTMIKNKYSKYLPKNEI